MNPHANTRPLAVLGGPPAFESNNRYGYAGEHSAVALDSILLSSRQRYVSKGVEAGENHQLLGLDDTKLVICISTALKAVARTEVIAVIMEDVDPHSWMLSPEATEKNISERTAAIVTVDWLGTHCDLVPFRKLANKHGVKLISDSAQSFGASSGKPSAFDLADASIYSTGFPKVFHTGESGGVLICSKSQADWLERESTGIFRHETMSEINAYQGLRALDELPGALEARTKAGNTYRQLLSDTPGITFQCLPPGSGANYYQLSLTVDAESFGLEAKILSEALQAENVLCSTERMLCLGNMSRLLQSCKVGDLPVSQALGRNSITLPIFNQLTPEMCGTICSVVKAIQEQSAVIIASGRSSSGVLRPLSSQPNGQAGNVIDIASKFRDCSVVHIIDDERGFTASGNDESVPLTVLVPRKYLAEHKISFDELHRRLLSKHSWSWGDKVMYDLVVYAKNGGTLFLSQRGQGHSQIMDESGCSAHVALVIGRGGELVIQKTCSNDGIDGNGRPWLRRQKRFLAASIAVKETDIFVKPLEFTETEDGVVSITFPYVPSHSLAEMAFASMGATPLLTVLADLLGEMATSVWNKGVCDAPVEFIEQAHFSRMKRRIEIACAQVPLLEKVISYESIMLNGRRLLGFERVLKALSRHSSITEIGPRKLGEIHGDLNIYNILCQLEPDANRPVVLIDPRGVPLLDEYANSLKAFEPGDYCYDLSKLKFSLSGFAEIRKGLFNFLCEGQSFNLIWKNHPGLDTMVGANRGFFKMLSSSEKLRQWVETVEPSGFQSMELRVLLGEAAHFVADSACALGRDKKEEVLPLFLIGLEKLNDVLELIEGESEVKLPALLGLGSLDINWTWDVMEVLVKFESTTTAQQLLGELVGTHLPEGTGVYVSTDPIANARFPCVLIHPFEGVRGQTHAVISGIRRTSAFLRDTGVSQEMIDRLRIVTVASTGASTGLQYTSRQNDKLLSPGPWGISPLKLSVLQANQLFFPRAGRWVVENDSFFVLSRALRVGGDGLCLLASKRPASGPSSWRVCIESTDEIDGLTIATGFREIGPDEKETGSLKHTDAIFVPSYLGQWLARKEKDYATRSSPLLIDFVLPRFMQRTNWIQLCHLQGFGVNSDLAWNNAEQIADLSPKVELAYGGDEMEFHSFGSESEYTQLADGVGSNPVLNSLSYLPSMAIWLRRQVGLTARSSR
ncbi:hypothetical protein BDP27DRAFT_1325861 [Rhodocollybia butyracea]|uniref:Uncharacterized protein n=1 Tax=Rhodocollybia butyracea TaxID=206335 RepID=A0A9P5U8S5_9AGAR|nr:hypothetical protein BDP27DRAFT_1325861 [Rhodocollybia butyracea]